MARETISQKRATKLEKLKAIQAEIDNLDRKASKRIGDLAIRAGLGELDIADRELLREFRAIAARMDKGSAAGKAKATPSAPPSPEPP